MKEIIIICSLLFFNSVAAIPNPYFGTVSRPSNFFTLYRASSSITYRIYNVLGAFSQTLSRTSSDADVSALLVSSQNAYGLTSQLLIGRYWNGPFQNLSRVILNSWTDPASLSAQFDAQIGNLQRYSTEFSAYTDSVAAVNAEVSTNLSMITDDINSQSEELRTLLYTITNETAQGISDDTNANSLSTVLTTILNDFISLNENVRNVTKNVLNNQNLQYYYDLGITNQYRSGNSTFFYMTNVNRIFGTLGRNIRSLQRSQYSFYSNVFVNIVNRTFPSEPAVWPNWESTYFSQHNNSWTTVLSDLEDLDTFTYDTTYNFGEDVLNTYLDFATSIRDDIAALVKTIITDVHSRLGDSGTCASRQAINVYLLIIQSFSSLNRCISAKVSKFLETYTDIQRVVSTFISFDFIRNYVRRIQCVYRYNRFISNSGTRADACLKTTIDDLGNIVGSFQNTLITARDDFSTSYDTLSTDMSQCMTTISSEVSGRITTIQSQYDECLTTFLK